MRRNPASVIDITEQELSELNGRLDPSAFYRVISRDGAFIRLLDSTGQAVGSGGGGGTTFTYDAVLQAGKATVDGQEVLAPKRSGNGALLQVVPRTNTLSALLATDGNTGEMSHPSNAPGVVIHSGTPGVSGEWIANGTVWYINASALTYNASSGGFDAAVPSGARVIYIGVVPRGTDESTFLGLPPAWVGQPVNLLTPSQPTALYRIIYSAKLVPDADLGRFGGVAVNGLTNGLTSAIPSVRAPVALDGVGGQIQGTVTSVDIMMSTETSSAMLVGWMVQNDITTYAISSNLVF